MKTKKILAAVDGSTYSDKVVEQAIMNARWMDAEVVLVYCHKKFPKILGYPHRDQMISAIMDETEKKVQPYVQRLQEAGVSYLERYMEGPAGTTIPSVADHEQCEMIIMGSRGLSNLEGFIIGSVTHKVLHLADCPVLVLK